MGDYSNQHNGFSDDRSTSFLWNLSKEWEVRVGAYIFGQYSIIVRPIDPLFV